MLKWTLTFLVINHSSYVISIYLFAKEEYMYKVQYIDNDYKMIVMLKYKN